MTGSVCQYCGGNMEEDSFLGAVCDCCGLIIGWNSWLDTSNMEPEAAEEAKQLLKDKYHV